MKGDVLWAKVINEVNVEKFIAARSAKNVHTKRVSLL
jgi:hypothetical protein